MLGQAASVDDPNLERMLTGAIASDVKLVRITEAQSPVLVRFPGGAPVYRLCLPVRVKKRVVALIWLDVGEGNTQELDERAVEHAGVVAALHLLHQQQLTEQEERLGYALVASLLDGEFNPSPSALERAQVCGWRDTTQYRVCLLLLDEPTPLSPDGIARREQLTTKLKWTLTTQRLPLLLTLWQNQIRFIIPTSASIPALWASVSDDRVAMAVSRSHAGVKGMAAGAEDVSALLPTLRSGGLRE
ncbi:hypothetical protein WDZ92_48005, partial [Nostoc sp. NIES-2111]